MASLRLSPSLDALVDALAQLPGFGPRSAQRAAFHLLQDPKRLERLERVRRMLSAGEKETDAL